MAMGSPISLTLPNFYTIHIENKIVNNFAKPMFDMLITKNVSEIKRLKEISALHVTYYLNN